MFNNIYLFLDQQQVTCYRDAINNGPQIIHTVSFPADIQCGLFNIGGIVYLPYKLATGIVYFKISSPQVPVAVKNKFSRCGIGNDPDIY